MFQSITFYVREKSLGIYGEEFPLGTLTTEVLNITPEEYQALDVQNLRCQCSKREFFSVNTERFPSDIERDGLKHMFLL